MDGDLFSMQLSDITLKKNVADWTENATDVLKSFHPRTFNWIGDPDGPPYEIGWIAQEGQPHIPEMFPPYENTSLLIVDIRRISVYLHKSTLELDSRITSIEGSIGDYYTKTEIDNLLDGYYTKTETDNLLDGYYTKTEIDSLFTSYYTKTEIDNLLDGYYTKVQSDARYVDLTSAQTISGIKLFSDPVRFVDVNTEISRDGSNNMIFTDAFVGTVTLTELLGDPPPITVTIPPWNMKSTPMIAVPHPFGAKENIAVVHGRVRDDDNDYLWQFTDDDGGFMYWDDTDIYLNRAANTKFNSNDFNSAAFDRGLIYITLAN